MHTLGRIGIIALFAVGAAAEDGRIWYVAPDAPSDGDGRSRAAPVRSLVDAVGQVRGGDEIVLLPGTHYIDGLTIRNVPGISPDRRLTIRAEPRGQATLSAAWPEAARGTVAWRPEGDGVYSAEQRHVDGRPVPSAMGGFGDHILLGWPSVADLRAARCPTNQKHGKGRPAFATPGYGFAIADGRVWLRLPQGEDPNGRPVVLSYGRYPDKDSRRAMVVVDGSPGLLIDGVRFEGAQTALRFTESSPHAVVRNCVFQWCHIGICLASDSVAEWNHFSYTGLRRLLDQCRERNDGRFDQAMIFSLGYDPVWMFGFFAGGTGKAERVKLCYNWIDQSWDGDMLGAFSRSQAHHNIYEDCIDNAVEFDQTEGVDLHLHRNLILGCANGVISHQRPEGHIRGPQYIYRNVIIGHADPGWDSWTAIKLRSRGASQGFHYLHNLIWMRGTSLYWRTQGDKNWEAAAASMDWRNNVLIFERLTIPSGPSFTTAGNVLVGGAGPLEALQGPGGFHLAQPDQLGYEDVARRMFVLRRDSRLIDAGVPLGDALPATVAHVPDGRPDIGPFEHGTAVGADWPRPRRQVFDDRAYAAGPAAPVTAPQPPQASDGGPAQVPPAEGGP